MYYKLNLICFYQLLVSDFRHRAQKLRLSYRLGKISERVLSTITIFMKHVKSLLSRVYLYRTSLNFFNRLKSRPLWKAFKIRKNIFAKHSSFEYCIIGTFMKQLFYNPMKINEMLPSGAGHESPELTNAIFLKQFFSYFFQL